MLKLRNKKDMYVLQATIFVPVTLNHLPAYLHNFPFSPIYFISFRITMCKCYNAKLCSIVVQLRDH
jgi:hypothetical protein